MEDKHISARSEDLDNGEQSHHEDELYLENLGDTYGIDTSITPVKSALEARLTELKAGTKNAEILIKKIEARLVEENRMFEWNPLTDNDVYLQTSGMQEPVMEEFEYLHYGLDAYTGIVKQEALERYYLLKSILWDKKKKL